MAKQMTAFGVIIPVKGKNKVVIIHEKRYPNQDLIKSCLDFELEQELKAIQTQSSGWRTPSGIKTEMELVREEYRYAVNSITKNKFIIKKVIL